MLFYTTCFISVIFQVTKPIQNSKNTVQLLLITLLHIGTMVPVPLSYHFTLSQIEAITGFAQGMENLEKYGI